MKDFSPGPPPALMQERVLQYAILDESVGYNAGHGLFFADGKELGKVPRLAISQKVRANRNRIEFTICHCDCDWEPLGAASGHASIDAAKKWAERIYPGSRDKWLETHFSDEEFNGYLDEVWAELRCSFCNRRPDQGIEMLFEGIGKAQICNQCVEKMHAEVRESPSRRDAKDDESN